MFGSTSSSGVSAPQPATSSRWFDSTADAILAHVSTAKRAAGSRLGPEFETTMTDLAILANLARFHARRSTAAVQYNLYVLTHDAAALDAAISGERAALDAW